MLLTTNRPVTLRRTAVVRFGRPLSRARFLAAAAAALAAGVTMGAAAPAGAATTLLPTTDTYVSSARPASVHGTARRLLVQRRRGDVRRAFLRFDVPRGATITRATLMLYAKSRSAARVELRRAWSAGWSERATWTRQPRPGAVVATVGVKARSGWVRADVTRVVRSGGLVDLALTARSRRRVTFASREDGRHAPRLVLAIAPVADGPVTPAPASPASPSPSPAPSTSPSPARSPVEAPPAVPRDPAAVHSTATKAFVKADGTPISSLGMNVIPVWNGSPGATWPRATYEQIRAKGFNTVRFTLYWDDFEPSRGSFNPTNLRTLDTAIARAAAAGLYVVLDMIHLWGSGGFNDVPAWARTGDSVSTVQANGAGFLKLLAQRYRHESAVIGYDLVNEFHRFPIDQNGVLRAYDALIDEVRSVDPDKIIILEPTYGDTSIAGTLADFSNLRHRRNIVWSIHDYFAGGDDDGYAADGQQTGTWVWDGTTGYAEPNTAQLEAHLLANLRKLREVGLPLWIGEFGIGEGVANHDRWIRDKVALFEKYGLGRSWWEYYTTAEFSAVDRHFEWKPFVDLLLAPE